MSRQGLGRGPAPAGVPVGIVLGGLADATRRGRNVAPLNHAVFEPYLDLNFAHGLMFALDRALMREPGDTHSNVFGSLRRKSQDKVSTWLTTLMRSLCAEQLRQETTSTYVHDSANTRARTQRIPRSLSTRRGLRKGPVSYLGSLGGVDQIALSAMLGHADSGNLKHYQDLPEHKLMELARRLAG